MTKPYSITIRFDDKALVDVEFKTTLGDAPVSSDLFINSFITGIVETLRKIVPAENQDLALRLFAAELITHGIDEN